MAKKKIKLSTVLILIALIIIFRGYLFSLFGFTEETVTFTDVRGDEWKAQTFETSEIYQIKNVSLKMWASKQSGTVTVGIRSVGDLTTDLVTGTYTWDWIKTATIIDVELSTYRLQPGQYAIAVRVPAEYDAYVYLNADDLYPNGKIIKSKDGGVTWSDFVSGTDMHFEINGEGPCRTISDIDCNGGVDRAELGLAISKWINNQISRDDLGEAIQSWTSM